MFDHVTIRVSDRTASERFYESVLQTLGIEQTHRGAAATELAHVSLPDALALCLLLRDREPARYPRAAVRWLGRYCCEEKGVTLDEAALMASHLAAFIAEDPRPTAQSLAALLDAHGRREIATAVRGWYVDAAAGG